MHILSVTRALGLLVLVQYVGGSSLRSPRVSENCGEGCVQGKCISPDTCTACDNEYELDRGTCILITDPENCDRNCKFGYCTSPDACAQCKSGYNIDDGGKCIPEPRHITEDEQEYTNDTCNDEGNCECFPGYKKVNESNQCVPECEQECINGQCTGPNYCTCDPGYEVRDGFYYLCAKPCVNCIGACTTDGVCICKPGYSKKGTEQCTPDCSDGCEDGMCLSPNNCKSCTLGYQNDDGNCVLIQPYITEDEQEYTNDTCNDEGNGECFPGYKKVNESNQCVPECEQECINGQCTGPNYCTCDQGYEVRDGSYYLCARPCVNCIGACTTDGVCICRNGYSKKGSEQCTPDCSEGCEHGMCLSPNNCKSCTLGYQNDDGNCVLIQAYITKDEQEYTNDICNDEGSCECFPGYKKVKESNHCVPECEEECINGQCTGPNYCTCDQGYEVRDGFYYLCAKPCVNCIGACTTDGVCICKPGYSKKGTEQCTPDCSEGCEDGMCLSPNNCKSCTLGYQNDNGNCVLIQPYIAECETDCTNGICNDEGKCICSEGYYKDGESNQCVPECEQECINGQCTGPNYCTCDPGYEVRDGSYYLCAKPCVNCIGACTTDGVCICRNGYSKKGSEQCTPDCSEGCEHGACLSPNYCTSCKDGYQIDGANCTYVKPPSTPHNLHHARPQLYYGYPPTHILNNFSPYLYVHQPAYVIWYKRQPFPARASIRSPRLARKSINHFRTVN